MDPKDWKTSASPALINSVESGNLTLRFAQLIALIPVERQTPLIERLSELPTTPSESELRHAIEGAAIHLDLQPFDKAGCETCQFNTTAQANWFDRPLRPGLCLSNACSKEKLEAHAFQQEAELKASRNYRIVKIVPVEQKLELAAVTQAMVGAEQLSHCEKQCHNYGAVVQIGLKASTPLKILAPVCFAPECRSQKAALWNSAQKREYAQQVLRHALARHIDTAPQTVSESFLLAALFSGIRWTRKHPLAAQDKAEPTVAEATKEFLGMSTAQRQEYLAAIGPRLVKDLPDHQLVPLIRTLKVRVQDHWTTDAKTLALCDRQEIQRIAQDLKMSQAIETTASAADASAELLKSLSEGQLRGYLPPFIREALDIAA